MKVSPRNMRIAAPLAAFIAFACAAAPLTDAEKALLQSGISASAAADYGRAGDAAALERIIRLGDRDLVEKFGNGMIAARREQMPEAAEALVVANFDDPRVGAALRAFQPRYRTRRLFDLHLARVRAAYRTDEPSFREILRTDQEGIEDALLQVAAKFPSGPGDPGEAAFFLARRKHPGAVPLLIAALDGSYQDKNAARIQNRIVSDLLNYPSVEVWRRAADEIDRLERERRITPEVHAAARRQMEPNLRDPQAALARMQQRDIQALFNRKRDALVPGTNEIAALRATDPKRYAEEQARFLAKQDAIVAEQGNADVGYGVGFDYFHLGMFVRFKLRDAQAAVPLFAKAASYRSALGLVALADTYQIELRDRAAALKAYEAALAEASRPSGQGRYTPFAPAGNRMNDFWRAWLAAEVEYERTGKPFHGRIPEPVIGGFFDALIANASMFYEPFADDVPMDLVRGPGFSGGRLYPAPAATDWDGVRASLERVERDGLAAKLGRLPPSRLALFVTLRPASALGRGEILSHLARNDPSGYWSACLMGTVQYFAARGDAGHEEAVRNGTAQLLPGMAAPGKPNALGAAAAEFMRARGLRVKLEPQ